MRYLVFAAGALLLLLYEVGGGGGRRRGPHAPDDPDAVLGERGQAQLLPLPHLDVLELLKAAQRELGETRSIKKMLRLGLTRIIHVT